MPTIMMACPRCWGKIKGCALCKSKGVVPDVQLSANFLLSEMLDSATARKKVISNEPTPEVIENLRKLCNEGLEPIRSQVGPIEINSGYRSPALNAAVRGSASSAHCFGLAADLDPVRCNWRQLMDAIIKSGVKFDQLIFEHTWVHFGLLHPRKLNQRNEKLVMNIVDSETVYSSYV
jgi:zinc D-Ala-D-Ala carboxypeptidase